MFTVLLQTLMYTAMLQSTMAGICTHFASRWKKRNCHEFTCYRRDDGQDIIIDNATIVKLNCNQTIPDEDIFKCAYTSQVLDGVVMHNCLYQRFNLKEFMHNTELKLVNIKENVLYGRIHDITISNLPSVKSIRIEGIRKTFWLKITEMRNLINFSIEYSQFKSIEWDKFSDLPQIETISVEHCNMEHILNSTLPTLESLKTLRIIDSNLSSIGPQSLQKFPQLRRLELQGNKLVNLKFFQSSYLPQLISANVANNRINTLENDLFKNLPNLEEIYLQENIEIMEFPKGFLKGASKLRVLHASQCSIQAIQQSMFSEAAYGKLLSVFERSSIRNIEHSKPMEASLKKKLPLRQKGISSKKLPNAMANFQILHLSRNFLSGIEENTFDVLVNLTEINLSGNPLSYLPLLFPFGPSQTLKRIILSDCKLKHFLDTWTFPRSLIELDLSKNEFEELPLSLMTILGSNSHVLFSLADNPWICECHTLNFITWIENKKDYISDYSEMECLSSVTSKAIKFKELFAKNTTVENLCKASSFFRTIALAVPLILISLVPCSYIMYQNSVLIGAVRNSCISFGYPKVPPPVPEGKTYHACLFFGKSDRRVGKTVWKNLRRHYKVCVQSRRKSAISGEVGNLMYSILNSNLTILIISDCFLKSRWFNATFRTAYYRLAEKDLIMCFISVGQIKLDDHLSDLSEIRVISLKWKEKFLWMKLKYILDISSEA